MRRLVAHLWRWYRYRSRPLNGQYEEPGVLATYLTVMESPRVGGAEEEA